MPRGQKLYTLGNSLMVHNMACGRMYSGEERQTTAQIAMHKKGCTICRNCKVHITDTDKSAPDENMAKIMKRDAKAADAQYQQLTGHTHAERAASAARAKLAELSATK